MKVQGWNNTEMLLVFKKNNPWSIIGQTKVISNAEIL